MLEKTAESLLLSAETMSMTVIVEPSEPATGWDACVEMRRSPSGILLVETEVEFESFLLLLFLLLVAALVDCFRGCRGFFSPAAPPSLSVLDSFLDFADPDFGAFEEGFEAGAFRGAFLFSLSTAFGDGGAGVRIFGANALSMTSECFSK